MFIGVERAKQVVLALCALSTVASLSSCATTKQALKKVYNGTIAVVKGTANSITPIKNAADNISTEYDELVEKDILQTKEELEDARYEDVADNRERFVGVVKDMARFILEKSAGDSEKNIEGKNIEYIIPDMEKEFLSTKVGKSYGGRKKNAVRVYVESFKIMTHYFSDNASKDFFTTASWNSKLCQTFPLLREKDDALTRKKAVISSAKMIGYTMDVSEDIMEKEKRLHYMMRGKRVLNYLRNKTNE